MEDPTGIERKPTKLRKNLRFCTKGNRPGRTIFLILVNLPNAVLSSTEPVPDVFSQYGDRFSRPMFTGQNGIT